MSYSTICSCNMGSAICSCNIGSEEEIEAQIRACGEHTAIRWIKEPIYRDAADAADKVRLLQQNDKESVAVRYYDQEKNIRWMILVVYKN